MGRTRDRTQAAQGRGSRSPSSRPTGRPGRTRPPPSHARSKTQPLGCGRPACDKRTGRRADSARPGGNPGPPGLNAPLELRPSPIAVRLKPVYPGPSHPLSVDRAPPLAPKAMFREPFTPRRPGLPPPPPRREVPPPQPAGSGPADGSLRRLGANDP